MNAHLTSSETSFTQLFGREISGLVIDRIEIPMIQRDYAQGRNSEAVDSIRNNFLDALQNAIKENGVAIGLDFIYGDVTKVGVDKGSFYPLDGQQRLTTLFLLHCYLAWRAGIEIKEQPWTKFTYGTRPSARLFCECLAKIRPSEAEMTGDRRLSYLLADQPWYLHTWQYDPTIQSMLVMLDALHLRFLEWSTEACKAAWLRLTDSNIPAISFHLLPMEVNGFTDDLYIKMNSRGKPLTAFENFKSNFESLLNKSHAKEKVDEFARKVDTDWADTLWPYRGDDHLIDDEFMRYFRFVSELRAWQSGIHFSDTTHTDALAEQLYGAVNPSAVDNFDFLLQAFDVWHGGEIKTKFDKLLTTKPSSNSSPLLLFNAFQETTNNESPVDLFAACCRLYGKSEWTMAHTLLLYAVLLDQIHSLRANATDFPKQLRILRNLIEASGGGTIRSEKMPALLADVKRVVVDGTLDEIAAFNQAQVLNERDKETLLKNNSGLQSALYRLEDHDLLRGCLSAFDLDPIPFEQRAEAFHSLFSNPACWSELTGALLAVADYSRNDSWRFSDFGAPKKMKPWRDLLSGSKSPALITALMSLLDQVAVANNDLTILKSIQATYLQQCTTALDWRYYFVKYVAMREGESGRYVGVVNKRGGYSICMLDKNRMSSYYRDPYLLAVLRLSGVGTVIDEPWFYGYETEPRRMILKRSGIRIQCVDSGWQITEVPTEMTQKAAFDQVGLKHGIDPNGLLAVHQDHGVDTCDRVVLGAQLLSDFVALGL